MSSRSDGLWPLRRTQLTGQAFGHGFDTTVYEPVQPPPGYVADYDPLAERVAYLVPLADVVNGQLLTQRTFRFYPVTDL
jgi:hypothetical protein